MEKDQQLFIHDIHLILGLEVQASVNTGISGCSTLLRIKISVHRIDYDFDDLWNWFELEQLASISEFGFKLLN